jgi:hypothetical protein
MVQQHRLVIERHLGRFLSGQEVVHHENGDPIDNRLKNLRLYASHREHLLEHQQRRAKRYDPALQERVRVLRQTPDMTFQGAAKRLCISPMTLAAALAQMGLDWPSRVVCHRGRHDPEQVLRILQSGSRAEAARRLGMSVMSLWRHYPREMQQTARQKSLKPGDRRGGAVVHPRLDAPRRTA